MDARPVFNEDPKRIMSREAARAKKNARAHPVTTEVLHRRVNRIESHIESLENHDADQTEISIVKDAWFILQNELADRLDAMDPRLAVGW